MKTDSINCFIAFRMIQRKNFLESDETFVNLDRHRHSPIKVTSFGDFVFNVCPTLLKHARSIATKEDSETAEERSVPKSLEKVRLLSLQKSKKQNILPFFEFSEGFALRLKVQPHLQKLTSFNSHCVLCGGGKTMRRSKFFLVTCGMYLCIRAVKGKRKSRYSRRYKCKHLSVTSPFSGIDTDSH